MRSGGGGGGGQYDLVSASGDASLRLIYGGDVQPVNVEPHPELEAVPARTSARRRTTRSKGVHYGVSVQWGPNTLIYNTKLVKPAPTSWSAIYSSKYKGKVTVPNNPIQIADAALYLMKTQPKLGIKDPYELTKAQLDASVNLLKQQKPLLKRYWASATDEIADFKNGDVVIGAGWPYQTLQLQAAKAPIAETIPKEGATGLGRHVDAREAGAASELRVSVDEVRHAASGRGEAGARVRRDAGQSEGVLVHEQAAEGLVRGVPPEPAAVVLQDDPLLEDAGRAVRLAEREQLHGLQRLAASLDAGHRVTLGG